MDPYFFLKRTEEPFSNIRTQIRFQPLKQFYINVDFDFDPYLTAFPRWQVDLVKEGLTFFTRVSWSYAEAYQRVKVLESGEEEEKSDYGYKESQNFFSTLLGFSILDNKWAFNIHSRYNMRSSLFVKNDFRVIYNSQCWSVQLRLMHHQKEETIFNVGELERDIENDYDIEMIVILRNVGPFEIL